MATKRWIGSTSTAVATAANWSGGVAPVNGDKVLFDGSAQNDCVGIFGSSVATNINIGPDFEYSIGTTSTAASIQTRFQNQVTTIDMQRGFANLELLCTDCVINSAPAGDNLYITGDIENCIVSGPGGNITFGSTSTLDCTTLIVAPNSALGPDPAVNVTIAGGTVGTLIASGPCEIEWTGTGATTAVLVGPKLRARLHNDLGTTKLTLVNVDVEQDELVPIAGGSGGLLMSNSKLKFKQVQQASVAASGAIDIYKDACLDMTEVDTLSAIGTITNYGGLILARQPVTMAVPSDTKLSSTSARSLDFSVAANSGHVPTVLW